MISFLTKYWQPILALIILATFSPKYSFYPRQLFLSATAPKGDLMRETPTYVRLAQ